MIEKDETWWSRLFFLWGKKGVQDWFSREVVSFKRLLSKTAPRAVLIKGSLPLKNLLPSKIFKKKFFRVGVWGGFE